MWLSLSLCVTLQIAEVVTFGQPNFLPLSFIPKKIPVLRVVNPEVACHILCGFFFSYFFIRILPRAFAVEIYILGSESSFYVTNITAMRRSPTEKYLFFMLSHTYTHTQTHTF